MENLLNFKNVYPGHKKNFEVDYQLALNYLALKRVEDAELIFQNLMALKSQKISNQAKIIFASLGLLPSSTDFFIFSISSVD